MKKRIEATPETVPLGKLVERITAGRVRVPKLQRTFVWRQDDLHQLLDSTLQGFPIGSILIWDTEEELETRTRIGPIEVGERPAGTIGYLLDGQQRMTTLAGTLQLPEEAEAIVDDVDWRVYCDLESLRFHRVATTEPEPQYFPIRNLLDTAKFFAACHRIEARAKDRRQANRWIDEADRLANAFRDYQLPVIHIREADLDSAITVFARLNRAGRRVAADELATALTYREGQFHLAEKLNASREKLASDGFGNLDRTLLLRSMLAALGKDIYAKNWVTLVTRPEIRERLQEALDTATQGLKRALAFLKTLNVTSDRLLPYGLQLVLLGEFFRLCPQPTDRKTETLIRWFWVTSFTGWFGAVNTTQVIRALNEIRELAQGKRTKLDTIDLDAPARPFPERFDSRSARVRAFLLYLSSLRPRSLRSTKHPALDLGQLFSTRGARAVGYVSSDPSQLDGLFASPANRMFVDADQVGQTLPDMAGMDDDASNAFLPTHGFAPDSIKWIRTNRPARLIEARLQTLIAGEREFMERRKIPRPTAPTEAGIADSEASDPQ